MSILYDGGGTANDMQVDTDIAAVIASGSGDIDVSGVNFIDIQLISAAADDTSTVAVLEFSGATPSATNLTRTTEIPLASADLVVDGDLLMVGLTSATAYLKQPFRVQFSHTTKTVKLSLSAETAGAKYIRYALGAGILGQSPITPLPVTDADATALLGKSTADVGSFMYDGGPADSLVEYATDALLIAASTGMTKIDCDGRNAIDIYLGNTVAAQSGTILVSEYSAATPTVATRIRGTEISIPTTDNASTVDRVIFGLVTGTEIPTKAPIRVAVTPGSLVLISLADDLAGGAWYARYQLHGSV